MWRLRARLVPQAVSSLALFVASIAAPHPGIYFHDHTGGDHPHLHPDDDQRVRTRAHEHHAHGLHHAPHAHAAQHAAEFEQSDDDTSHWHSQDLFQRAVAPTLTTEQHVDTVQAIAVSLAQVVIDRSTLLVRVRGPPRPA